MSKLSEWKEKSRELVYDGWRKLEKVIFELPDGHEDEFIIKKEGDVVCTLAITEDDQVVIAKQYRPGPGKILQELPGGGVDKDEKPEIAAARELLEETGYAGDIEVVTTNYDCAWSTRERTICVATNCKKVAEQQLEKNEFAEIELMSLDEFREHLRSGQLTDVATGYIGLDYLGLL